MSQAWTANQVAVRHLLTTQRLRQRRDELGLTQKQVVTRLARCGLQTTNRALSSLEHGSGLDVAKLPELAIALDCTVTYLIGLTDDPHSWVPDAPLELPLRSKPLTEPDAEGAAHLASTALTPTGPASTRPSPPVDPAPESLILGSFVPERLRSPDRFVR